MHKSRIRAFSNGQSEQEPIDLTIVFKKSYICQIHLFLLKSCISYRIAAPIKTKISITELLRKNLLGIKNHQKSNDMSSA